MKKHNLDISSDRLSLSNMFTKESRKSGWLQIDIANLELEVVHQISVNLADVEDIQLELEKKIEIEGIL